MNKTRPFSVNGVDKTLCDEHAKAHATKGDKVGVPNSAAAFMLGLLPWPTGDEPCEECS